mmetsp:Transcript_9776/g.23040  ORF Transcript_9776/g.23040 Transcript_9776/m.23040 type:complete len:147 (+) Transcript_9776:35-475(+)
MTSTGDVNNETSKVGTTSSSSNVQKGFSYKQMDIISEFLNEAEDIAMSTSMPANVALSSTLEDYRDSSCNGGAYAGTHYEDPMNSDTHSHDGDYSIANDEALVRDIIANDDRLRKEIEEFLETNWDEETERESEHDREDLVIHVVR